MTQWYLKDFARPERIARRPKDKIRKEEERMKPCIETRPKALCTWCFSGGANVDGVEVLASDT